ncbi:hypothetical protein EJ07DRAFT_152157 [Lizonia empirigonia]|nr:hypothetical protein EJ07DRAFT_152157 [Lizonia empirigonia]
MINNDYGRLSTTCRQANIRDQVRSSYDGNFHCKSNGWYSFHKPSSYPPLPSNLCIPLSSLESMPEPNRRTDMQRNPSKALAARPTWSRSAGCNRRRRNTLEVSRAIPDPNFVRCCNSFINTSTLGRSESRQTLPLRDDAFTQNGEQRSHLATKLFIATPREVAKECKSSVFPLTERIMNQ